jgi:pyruvate dehydrogenase E2 component (dihydrolipoamide acetyltransferase)
MADRVVLPKLGLTAASARLVGWLVEIGDHVDTGTPICEIETDKVVVSVDTPVAGVVLARAEPGLDIPVGATMAIVGREGETPDLTWLYRGDVSGPTTPADADPRTTTPADPSASHVSPRPAATKSNRAAASPAARARAVALGVDLDSVVGTGPGGRITLEDVESASRHS